MIDPSALLSWLPALLLLIGLLASVRWLLQPALRRQPLRLSLLLLLQTAMLGAAYLALFPPARIASAVSYAVVGPGTSSAQLAAARAAGQTLLRLPEAPAVADALNVPDLASALRQHPDITQVALLGDGLPARDRHTTPVALQFQPPALSGITTLRAPPPVVPGNAFSVGGQVAGVAKARLSLLDPAGRVVDQGNADASGHFTLSASVRDAGRTLFELHLLDADNRLLQQVPVPVQVNAAPGTRLWLLAGAPNAENKYLQRWASDAGIAWHSQFALGDGIAMGTEQRALNAAHLLETDLLVLDERALAGLSAAQRSSVGAAIHAGLGVLVRLAEPPGAELRQLLAQWGLPLQQDARSATARMESGKADAQRLQLLRGPRPHDTNESEASPALHTLRLGTRTPDAVPLLHDIDGNALGYWRSLGRGRIGVLALSDSYTLVLAGRDDLHAQLWSGVAAQLMRPHQTSTALQVTPARSWANERTVLCGVEDGDTVSAPDGSLSTLRVDPATPGCAALWPATAGWYTHQGGAAFHVLDPASAPQLHRSDTVSATALLAAQQPAAVAGTSQRPVPGPRWPWLLLTLVTAAALWWLERRSPRA